MVRRSRSVSYLVPIQAAGVLPIQVLPANDNREVYSIQNRDAANSVFVSPNQNVTSAVGPYTGQEITRGNFVSDDTDQGPVYAIGITAAAWIVVQETISINPTSPGGQFERQPYNQQSRTTFKRATRVM